MADNLRIIYKNLVDLATTTITASSTQSAGNTPVSNLKTDTKSKVWRSASTTSASTTVKAILLVDLGSATTIGGVALAFTNLVSASAVITLTAYSAAPTLGGTLAVPTLTGGTQVYQQASQLCCPWNVLDLAGDISNYSYGRGTHARVWCTNTNRNLAARYIGIEITDTYPTSASGRYIEVAKLIIGQYWSPKYNLGYGADSTIKDLSSHYRTEAGDLVTKQAPRFNTLRFDMKWLDIFDRAEMTKILLGNGMSKPMFISLYPSSSSVEQERAHQIFGKLSTVPGVPYTTLDIYSTSLEVEEI